MRVSAGMSSSFVSPTIGWMKRPSTISRAALVRYSCARWIGLRVWKPTIVSQPLAVERRDARVRLVGGAVDLLGLAAQVALVDLLDEQRAELGALVADQRQR